MGDVWYLEQVYVMMAKRMAPCKVVEKVSVPMHDGMGQSDSVASNTSVSLPSVAVEHRASQTWG